MNPADLAVTLVATSLMGWELWFFLRAPTPQLVRKPDVKLAQEVRVWVDGVFRPDTILVEAGRPVRLVFYRSESAARSEQVTIERLNIVKALPVFEATSVDFIPSEPGDYLFHCGACVGRLVALIGGEGARANLGRGHQKHG